MSDEQTIYPPAVYHRIAAPIEGEKRALHIADVRRLPDGGAALVPSDVDYLPIFVDAAWVFQHKPHAGGYHLELPGGGSGFASRLAEDSDLKAADVLAAVPRSAEYVLVIAEVPGDPDLYVASNNGDKAEAIYYMGRVTHDIYAGTLAPDVVEMEDR